MNRKHRGFTMIEVCIVVAIIGLLLAIAIPSFRKAKKQVDAKMMGVQEEDLDAYLKEEAEFNKQRIPLFR